MNDDEFANLLELVLAGRPERVDDLGLAGVSAEVRREVARIREAVGAFAIAASRPSGSSPSLVEPRELSPGLRSRILASAVAKSRVARKALIVMDMINDHLEPGRPLEVPRARAIVARLVSRIEAARASGMPVVYVLDEHDADDSDIDQWRAHAIKGSHGADVWAPLAPQPTDKVVRKPTYSGFTRSRLDGLLDELGVDTLVLTGCLTEIGIFTTATDALQRGFNVEIPADSQAGTSEVAEQVTLAIASIMPPYGPARKARLEKLGSLPA